MSAAGRCVRKVFLLWELTGASCEGRRGGEEKRAQAGSWEHVGGLGVEVG